MPSFNYGGQAVIEGVMMRGSHLMAVAVRDPKGRIVTHSEPLSASIYIGLWSRIPFLRAITTLWDTLVLGMRMLTYSANVALAEENVEFKGPMAWGTIIIALVLGIGIFFVAPLFLVSFADRYIASSFLSNLIEGIIRLVFFVTYIILIGFLPDVRRLFGYHGAEHKTINAYEDGAPLEVGAIRRHSTAHARCGTGFLLTVLVVSIFVFALLGRPPMEWRVLSRIVLIPVIVGLSYEAMKFGAAHRDHPVMRLILAPNLALQSLTTREPDDGMIEVAIAALQQVLASEQ